MWLGSWVDVGRTVLVGVLAYGALVTMLRLTGARTLAKLNAFDLIVTVALGSTLATVLLSSSVSLTRGVVALALLVVLQLAVAWTSVHSRWFRRAVRSQPTALLRDGRLLVGAMRDARITSEEVRQALRATGSGDLADVAAVVLETDGTLSVVPLSRLGDGSALADVPAVDGG